MIGKTRKLLETDRCPFCGNKRSIDIVDFGPVSSCYYQVICNKCEAEGPRAYTFAEAIRLWNDRKGIK